MGRNIRPRDREHPLYRLADYEKQNRINDNLRNSRKRTNTSEAGEGENLSVVAFLKNIEYLSYHFLLTLNFLRRIEMKDYAVGRNLKSSYSSCTLISLLFREKNFWFVFLSEKNNRNNIELLCSLRKIVNVRLLIFERYVTVTNE